MSDDTPPSRPWSLYLLECQRGQLYAGISPDPERRYAAHLAGRGARYTRANPPVRLLAVCAYPSRSAASVAEHWLKSQTRSAKLAWAARHAGFSVATDSAGPAPGTGPARTVEGRRRPGRK